MIRLDTTIDTNKMFVLIFHGPYRVYKMPPNNDRYVLKDISNCQQIQLPYDTVL